jgi:chitinase
MLGDWVFDDAEKLFLRRGGADGHAMQKLDHQTSEAFESTGDADSWVDFDEYAFGGVDVDLELAGLVDGRVEESEKALWELVEV